MLETPDDGVFLDIEVTELVDGCISSSVPIFIMAQYSKCVQQDPLISESCLIKLSKKMLDNWSKIVHNHKHLITEEDLRNVEYSSDYPKRIDIGVQQMRYIYYGTKCRNSS